MCEAMRTWACRPAALECRGPAFPVDALKTWSASLTEMWPFETSTWGAAVSARERAGPRERRRGPYLVPRADDHHGRPQEQPGVYEHEEADADDPHARLDDFPQADPLPPERPPQRPAGRRRSHFAPPLAPCLAPVDPQPPACPPWEVGHLSLAHLPRPVPPPPARDRAINKKHIYVTTEMQLQVQQGSRNTHTAAHSTPLCTWGHND